MRLRFLAAAGPAAAREQLEARIRSERHCVLLKSFSGGCLSLWTERGTPLLKNQNGSAALVGLLFDRSSARRLTALPDWPTLDRILVRDFWGSYVLFTTDAITHSVLRDPSGSIPVYYGSSGALQLYASDADMLRLAWPEPFRPDLGAARHWLKFPFMRTERTGALGVSELLPGMMRAVGGGGASLRQIWSPRCFAAPASAIPTFAEAGARLREEILRSVPLLAAQQPNVVLQLSGGLDSSILAAALAHGGISFRAITFATRSADGDERRYARQVARHFGIDLHEISEPEIDRSSSIGSGPLQRPPSPLLQPLRRALLAAAGTDAALLLDGGGGDNVFASINTATPAIDAFRRLGIVAGVRSLHDIAARHGCTFWAAGASALRRARRGRIARWPADESFLAPPFAPETAEMHPWLASSDGLDPGSSDHLRMIVGVFHFLADPAPDESLNLHPLLSQPIVELCLKIPSWLWVEGGRDRAVARAAFRNILPDEILDRRGKGSLQSMIVKGFAARRSELRDYLVSGRLAEQGIIDAAAIAAYFDGTEETRDAGRVRILELASAEQWLRSFG